MTRVCLAFLVAFLFVAPAKADTSVTLKPVVELRRESIWLGDVFEGVPEGIDRAIAVSPAPGKSVTYDTGVLTRLASQYRLSWHSQNLAERAVLTRASTHISSEQIRDVLLARLKEQESRLRDNVTLEALFDNRNLAVDLPAERGSDFTLDKLHYDKFSKRFKAELRAETVVVPVTGRLVIKRDVPVLAKRLDQGAVIGEADLTWLTIPDERVNGDIVTDVSQLTGRELRRAANADEPLHARDLMPPRLVVRGTLVTLKVEAPGILVTSQGRALQDGGAGDVVKVTNTQSNRTIEGVVESPGTVRVVVAQRVASAQ